MVLGCKAWRMVSTTGRRTPPENLVGLVFPGIFHRIDVFQFEIDGVPTVGVLWRASVVIMTGYADIKEAVRFRGTENGIKSSNSSPIGEEVTLLIMCVRE